MLEEILRKLVRLNDEITKKIKDLQECVKKKNPKECVVDAIRFLAFIQGYIDAIFMFDIDETTRRKIYDTK